MKGLISGIKRMEIHDGDGLRTTIFFKGCPLKCVWCHNPESIPFEKQIAYFKGKCIQCGTCQNKRDEQAVKLCPTEALSAFGQEYELNELVDEIMLDAPFFENSGGGVTFSGGECLAQPDFAVALAKELFEKGISVYIDTCGYVKQETFERIIPYTEKFLFDIKAFSPDVHKQCTGQTNELILNNLKFLSDKGCQIEIRYPLVMGYNDKECEKIGEFLSSIKGITKVKVLQYHNLSGSRYDALGMKNTLPVTETTYQDVEDAVNTLRNYGLNAINGIKGD